MMMKKALPLFVTAALCVVSIFVYAPSGLAHPPWAPFDDTRFAPIEDFGPLIKVETVATGVTSPLKGVVAPGEPNRLYVVDQVGKLWAIDLTTSPPNNKTLFLDVSARLVTLGVLGPNTFDERGFLGVAFHPNYQRNGLLYTYTSEPNAGPPTFPTTLPPGTPADHQNVIAEWRAVSPGNPAMGVDPASRRELMRIDHPQFNHDGGDLGFGPDRMLHISIGDGGGADDTDGQLFIKATGSFPIVNEPIVGHQGDGNAQKLNTPHGKILRIDVNPPFNSANGRYRIPADNPFVTTPGAVKEIWAFGLRNPYRFSFDTKTGALLVGDVGQNDIEEVDLVVKGGNFGWNCKEGTLFFDPNGNNDGFATPTDPGRPGCHVPMIDPIAQYDTHHEGHAVIGGFVYRGRNIPQLRGRYVFGDFSRLFKFPTGPFHDYGRLFHLKPRLEAENDDQGEAEGLRRIREFQIVPGNALDLAVLGMGQDASGEVYVMGNISGFPFGTGGVVLRLAPHRPRDRDDDD